MPIKVGDKFNRLTAIKFSYRNAHGSQHWFFRCDCGNEKIIMVDNVKRSKSKSCGCLKKEQGKKLGEINLKHGMTKTRTFKSWGNLKQRCLNKNDKGYKNYGGRGIKVCDEWLEFENFYCDMGECPAGKSIDRKNNDKGYYKSNCRWATREEQNNNKRNNRFLIYDGKKQTTRQWARELGINPNTISTRIYRGWSVERALSK